MEGTAIAGIDHAFNCVELSAEELLAFPGDDMKLKLFGNVLIESPETKQVELNLRLKLDAAEAKTMASCAEM